MHPFLPNDIQIVTDPEATCSLDNVHLALTNAEADRLVSLSSRLTGRHPLNEITDTADDEALILKPCAAALLFDIPLSEDGVYFLSTLTQWGIPAAQVKATVPLTGTAQFIALQHRLAHVSVLDYLAGSATLEVDPEVFSRIGDPHAPWEKTYDLDPGTCP